jgi:hypothetical protein
MALSAWKISTPYFRTAAARTMNSPAEAQIGIESLVAVPGPWIGPPRANPGPPPASAALAWALAALCAAPVMAFQTLIAKSRTRVAALIYMMTNGVIFGAGLIAVMTVPALADDAAAWIPLVVVASFILAAPAAWFIAPWMRSRFGQKRRAQSVGAVRPL